MQAIFESLERGGILLTATRRLARVLRRDYASWQRDKGRTVWNTPHILPLDAYVHELWSRSLACTSTELLLLSAEQEAAVWTEIISGSPEGGRLLQIDATARRAMEAWRLIHSWRLPLDGRFQATEDCAAFRGWAREFERRAAGNNWLDPSRLPDFVLARLRAGEIPAGSAWFAGFDELSPQQRDVLNEIGAQPCAFPPLRSTTRTTVCAAADDEIRCAAAWARRILEDDPAAQIGIVVLNLVGLRSRVERIFRAVLQPASAPEAASAFHISLGRPLAQYPIVHAALAILEFIAAGSLPLPKAGLLLRSPFIRGAVAERMARGSLDARLRRSHAFEITPAELSRQASANGCPALNQALRAVEKASSGSHTPQTYDAWSRTFSAVLEGVGWPGDRPLNSHEHQLLRRWTELLSEFASMDTVSSAAALPRAFERLHALAAGAIFQFEDTGAPVQISDPLEIAGIRVDHLWVMGLHDEALPAAADPNPFLPISLQWEYRLPNASAARRHESAKIVFDRLSSSAPDVVLSFPNVESDRILSPSPLLTAAPESAVAGPSVWVDAIRASAVLETFVDESAPPLDSGAAQRGGVRLLQDMAACPFRAFAGFRLGLKQLECVESGLTPAEKGTALHEVLKRIWDELQSSAVLSALSANELLALIRRNIAAVLDRFGDSTNVAVERLRLERLLSRWMDLERRRAPFTVLRLEETRPIEVGGLHLEVKADRIDELPDDRRIILDYKTGDVKKQSWSGPRLDEPQIPLYCISSEAPIAAAAFARIRAEEVELLGIAARDVALPEFESIAGKNDPGLSRQIDDWRRVLVALAEQFQAGDARVDPKYAAKTCQYCAIVPLCRVREYSLD